MAAVVVSHPAPARPLHQPGLAPARPHLRVLPGGRAGVRRQGRLHPAVYRRRRLAVLLFAVVLAAVAFLAVTGARTLLGAGTAGPSVAAAPVATPGAASPTTYVVQPGDTLWGIARQLQPTGDVRPVVDRLAERVGGASLEAGQRLRLDGLTD